MMPGERRIHALGPMEASPTSASIISVTSVAGVLVQGLTKFLIVLVWIDTLNHVEPFAKSYHKVKYVYEFPFLNNIRRGPIISTLYYTSWQIFPSSAQHLVQHEHDTSVSLVLGFKRQSAVTLRTLMSHKLLGTAPVKLF